MFCGLVLGCGVLFDDILFLCKVVIEGVVSVLVVVVLVKCYGIEMLICEVVEIIFKGEVSVEDVIEILLVCFFILEIV